MNLDLNKLDEHANDVQRLATAFNKSVSTIKRWIQEGKFPKSQSNIWTKGTVIRWIEEQQPSEREIKQCARNFFGY